MTRRRNLRTALVLGSLAALMAVGLAAAQTPPKVGSGDIVADRQRLMKLNGASWQDAQAKLKTGNTEAIAVNAETIALNAMHIPALFPQGSLTDKSIAKPDIWQKWTEFQNEAKNLQSLAEKLRDAARAKDTAAVEAMARDFGRQTCGSCHTKFRFPPKS